MRHCHYFTDTSPDMTISALVDPDSPAGRCLARQGMIPAYDASCTQGTRPLRRETIGHASGATTTEMVSIPLPLGKVLIDFDIYHICRGILTIFPDDAWLRLT